MKVVPWNAKKKKLVETTLVHAVLAKSIRNVVARSFVGLLLFLCLPCLVSGMKLSGLQVKKKKSISHKGSVKKQFRNMLIAFDSSLQEKYNYGFVCNAIENALLSKNCYILAQTNVFKNVYTNLLLDEDIEILKSSFVYEFYKKSAKGYGHDTEKFMFLIIPKQYYDKVKLSGLNINKTKLRKIENILEYLGNINFVTEYIFKTINERENSDVKFSSLDALKDVLLISKDFSWNFFQIGHGLPSKKEKIGDITGISTYKFKEEMDFLNENFDVNAFVANSCYSGGLHWFVPYGKSSYAGPSKLKFPIVQIGLPDSPNFFNKRDKNRKFDVFFDNLSNVNKKLLIRLKKALSALHYQPEKEPRSVYSSVPFVRYAGSMFFFPIILDEVKDKLGHISGVLVRKYQLLKKAFIVDASNCEAVFVSPSYVSIPIKFINSGKKIVRTEKKVFLDERDRIRAFPAIISLYPGSAVHFFDKFEYDFHCDYNSYDDDVMFSSLRIFFEEIAFAVNRELRIESQKIFFIRHIKFSNLRLENVVILLSPCHENVKDKCRVFFEHVLKGNKRYFLSISNEYKYGHEDKRFSKVVFEKARDRKIVFSAIKKIIKNITSVGYVERDMEGNVVKLPSQRDYRPILEAVATKIEKNLWNHKKDPWKFIWSNLYGYKKWPPLKESV